jgi:hypothetical protein
MVLRAVAVLVALAMTPVPREVDAPASIIAVAGVPVSVTIAGITVAGPAAVPLAAMVDPTPEVTGDRGGGFSKGATLTTTLKDPDNPDEPVVVTTIQGATETDADFIERHMVLVKKTRKYIKDHSGAGG